MGSEPALQQRIPRSGDDILDTGDFLKAFDRPAKVLLRRPGPMFDGQVPLGSLAEAKQPEMNGLLTVHAASSP